MVRSFTLFGQRDYPGFKLGTSTIDTIASAGCFLTSLAMKASYYGHTITPPDLNNEFISRNLYHPLDLKITDKNLELLSGDELSKVFADCQYVNVYDYTNIPTDLNLLKTLLADLGNTVTIEIDFDHNLSNGIQTHFVEAQSYDGTTLMIYDPWFKSVDNFTKNYGTDLSKTILKFIVYHGTPVTPANPNLYKGLDLTNQDSMKVAVDIWDAVVNGHQYVSLQQYQNDIKALNDSISGLKDTITADNQLMTEKDDMIASQKLPDDSVIVKKADLKNMVDLVAKVKTIIWGKGWPWTKVSQVKALIPKDS
jgi:hypothetical protein